MPVVRWMGYGHHDAGSQIENVVNGIGDGPFSDVKGRADDLPGSPVPLRWFPATFTGCFRFKP